MLLTGANIVASPVELHHFLQIIRPDHIPDFIKFANRYCDPKKEHDGIQYNGASYNTELKLLY